MSNVPVQRHHENRLLATLPSDTLSLFEPALKEISAPQGTVFLEPGSPIENVFFPQSMISLLVVTTSGNMLETSTIGREGAVGLNSGLGARRSFTRATVQVPGRFSVISARSLQTIVFNSPAVREMINRYIEVLWAEAQQIAACNAVHDARSRFCRWLLQVADRIDSDVVPLTQEFLSQMLGVRRTTVTLLAQEMQRNNLIKYTRGRVMILDRSGLEACACECYGVIQQEKLPLRIGIDI